MKLAQVLLFLIYISDVYSKSMSPIGRTKVINKNKKGSLDSVDPALGKCEEHISSKAKKKLPHRKIILPSKKEPIATKALRAIDVFSKTVLSTAESVVESSKKAKRELKAYFSSDFETLLLRLTRPDEERPAADDVEKMLLTIEAFSRNLDLSDENNPYRITLHKLWVKASEQDERTVFKALFLIHSLLRNVESDDALIFRTLMLKMSKEMCLKTQCRYFDFDGLIKSRRKARGKKGSTKDAVGSDSGSGGDRSSLVQRYASFCLKRGRAVTAGFEELRLVGLGMRPEDICAQILKAIKLLDAILDCKPAPGEENEASVSSLELLVRDLQELSELFHEKLRWLQQEHRESGGVVFEGWTAQEISSVMGRFTSFHNSRLQDIQSFLLEVGSALELYGIAAPAPLDLQPIAEEL